MFDTHCKILLLISDNSSHDFGAQKHPCIVQADCSTHAMSQRQTGATGTLGGGDESLQLLLLWICEVAKKDVHNQYTRTF
jgi:hypothetical protein